MIGQVLSHFRVVAELGRGGMGEVYRAEDTKLGREVAIKVLPESFVADEQRLARFEREARVLASLSHPGIAGIHEVGEQDGIHFLVMELAEGETLAERIDHGAMDQAQALPIALNIAHALEAAHEQGIIHRDLKPANVMVTEPGEVKVLDFGLAKALPSDASKTEGVALCESPTLTEQMTQLGTVLGTAAYMSPEQARGKQVDKRTDIWSFGCLLFEMLAGQRPFQGETASDTIAAILEHEPSWENLPGSVSTRILDLLRRCLVKNPIERLRDIGDARIELEGELGNQEITMAGAEVTVEASRTPRLMYGVGIVVLLVIAAAIAVWRWLPERPVAYLIDTTARLGVYDPETRNAGGTNADDITDALGNLPLTLIKETASPFWRREHQVLMQQPNLILIHKSVFAHQPGLDSFEEQVAGLARLEELRLENPRALGHSKLIAFLGYVALGSPDTRFVVYSRGSFDDEGDRIRWISECVGRFPQLEGRIILYPVPGAVATATFRNPETAAEIRNLVASTLALD